MMRGRARAAGLAALVAVLAGCGSHSGDDGTDADASAVVNAPAEARVRGVVQQEVSPWGYTVVELAAARVQAAALPLDVAAGRVIVASWNSPDAAGAGALVATEHLAGVVVMGDAVVGADQVRALTAAVAAAAAADGQTAPALISTDQEGGPVARLAGVVPDMPAFMAAGAQSDKSMVREAYGMLALDMRALGFTADWAPVADVTVGAADPTIGARSAGTDPANVSATVVAAIEGMAQNGILTSVKHFPGHGSVTTDSHVGLPVQPAPVAALAERDLVPFQGAIDAAVPMVMMGHVVVPEWGGAAASVNPAAYTYLRDTMGFGGVTVTDALNMAALAEPSPGANAVAALAAGADVLLLPADPVAARQAIIAAVTSGAVPRARLDEAIARIHLMMTAQAAASEAVEGEGFADADYARHFAASSAAVSTPSCGVRLVGDSVVISGGLPGEREVLAQALAEHGIATGSGTTVRLLGSATGTGTADVVVALDAPWGLASSTAGTYVGLFGRSDDALRGLADVLAGAEAPHGSWPVAGMPASCA